MGILQDAIDQSITDLPCLAMEALVADKLKAAGQYEPGLARRVAAAIMARDEGDDIIDPETGEPLDIAFNDEDFARIERASETFIDSLPSYINTLIEEAAAKLAEGFMEQWQELPHEDDNAENRAKILTDWRAPLDRLRMLIALCEQEGEEFNVTHLTGKRKTGQLRAEALARLHIRACRIAREIVLLIENGFTEGAQARWRTLHEVTITATLIAEGGDNLAGRYFDHDAVERKRALDDHRRAAAAADEPASPKRETVTIEDDFARAVKRHGKRFQGMYGWAGGQLGIPEDPKFHDLQKAAGSLALKLRYRLASFDTHASTGTLDQPVHRWDPTTHIPGAFAAGFEEPAADTAQALVQVTGLLRSKPWDADAAAMGLAMIRLRNETATAWSDVARRIARREQRALDRAAHRPGRQRRYGYVKAKPRP